VQLEFCGRKIKPIGLGTWQFGAREWGYGPEYNEREAKEILKRAIELNVGLIDTAEAYGWGKSEKIIGEVIKDCDNPPIIATKIFPVAAVGPVVENRFNSSLRRLGHIDLYQVHWPNPVIPFSVTMKELKKIVDAGDLKYVGVSNFNRKQWQAAETYLEHPIVSNQVLFNLVDNAPLHTLVDYAKENNKVILAYSPIGQGLLSGRYDADHRPRNLARAINPRFLPENITRAYKLIEMLKDLSLSYDATPSQIALAWLISFKNVIPIPGAASVKQLESNMAAAEIKLKATEIKELTEESKRLQLIKGPRAQVMAISKTILDRVKRN
jgi:aryl-alcohol dehydrogenase-like predicted oxidoreductase